MTQFPLATLFIQGYCVCTIIVLLYSIGVFAVITCQPEVNKHRSGCWSLNGGSAVSTKVSFYFCVILYHLGPFERYL